MAQERELQVVINAKDEASAKMKSIGDSIQGGLKKVGIAAGVAGAALGAMVYKSAKDLGDLGETLDNMQKKTGASAGALSGLKVAADEMGLSLDSVTGAMSKMNKSLSDALDGSNTANDALDRIGLTAKDLAGMKTEDAFLKIGNAMAAIEDPVNRTAVAMGIFGKSGAELVPLFDGGKASLDGFSQAAKDAGLYMDEVSMNKALALDQAMDKLNSTMAGVKQTVALALAPAITGLLESITPVITKISEWIAQNPALTVKIIEVTGAVLGLLVFLPILVSGITAVGTVLAFVAANPIVLIIAALAALVVAIVLIVENWEYVKQVTIEVWASITEDVGNAIEAVKTILTDLIENGLAVLIGWWNDLASGVGAVWTKIVDTVKSKVDAVKNYIADMVGALKGALDKLSEFSGFTAYGNAVKSAGAATGKALGLRKNASGGNVMAGQSTVVGEHGAEVVTFAQGGRVIPNNRIGGSSMNLTVVVKDNTLLADSQDVAVKLGDLIMQRFRLQMKLS